VTPDGLVTLGEWTSIGLHYDRQTFRISVGGLEAARIEQDGLVRTIDGPLLLGASGAPFPGAIDDLVISAVAVEEAFELPEAVEFAPGTVKAIHFQAGGGLDRRIHREPVDLPLIFEDGREDRVRVNLYGTVE
jgi:hypothetical protein